MCASLRHTTFIGLSGECNALPSAFAAFASEDVCGHTLHGTGGRSRFVTRSFGRNSQWASLRRQSSRRLAQVVGGTVAYEVAYFEEESMGVIIAFGGVVSLLAYVAGGDRRPTRAGVNGRREA